MEDILEVLIVIISIIVSIVIDYFVAKRFYSIAIQKGFEDKAYFWYSFILLPVGYLMVIALPDHSKEVPATSDELPEL